MIAGSPSNRISKLQFKSFHSSKAHPNLKVDYFNSINSKEKAYWLGFLYADGCITRNQHGSIQVRFELSRDSEDVVDRFCLCLGLDKNKKEYRLNNRGEKRFVEIRFACKETSSALVEHGLMFQKSKIVEYPMLPDESLELAFLLGYYDGDGQQGTTRISSGSIRFLEQIKNRFHLPYRIHVTKGEREIDGRKLTGTVYYMSLGPVLFNKMMKDHADSAPRKRWYPCESDERNRRAAKVSTSEMVHMRREQQKSWRAIKKDELEKLVWETPSERIATNYGVSGKAVEKKCKKLGIPKPERGYWARHRI